MRQLLEASQVAWLIVGRCVIVSHSWPSSSILGILLASNSQQSNIFKLVRFEICEIGQICQICQDCSFSNLTWLQSSCSQTQGGHQSKKVTKLRTLSVPALPPPPCAIFFGNDLRVGLYIFVLSIPKLQNAKDEKS